MKQSASFFSHILRMRHTWKKLLSFLFPIGVLVGIVAVLQIVMTLATPTPSQAAWMDLGWGFRQRIAFTNSGSADSDKKISLSIDTSTLITAGQLQSACQDLRFTDQQGKVLKYYINTAGGACNTASTNVFVLLPVIVPNANDIFMYYGNPSAPAGTQQSQFSQSTFSPGTGPTANTAEIGAAPAGWWKFDDATGTSAKDSSTNANTATLASMASPPSATSGWQTEDQCVSGKCLRFDGTNDNVALGPSGVLGASLKPTTALSVSAWFKTTANNEVILRARSGGYALEIGNGSTAGGTSNKVNFWIYNGNFKIANSTNSYNDGNWHQATGTYDGTNVSIYVDGILTGQTAATGSISYLTGASETGYVGIDQPGGFGPYTGTLDEIKIYRYARTAAQVKSDFLSAAAGIGSSSVIGTPAQSLSNGLVGYWKMDEASWTVDCSTGSVVDAAGNGLNGAACPSSTGPTGGAAGKFGNGASLDGSDDYISVTDSSNKLSVGSGSHTVSAWVKTSTASNIIVYSALSGSSQEYMYVLSNGKVRFNIKDDSANELAGGNFDSTTTVNNGAWHLVTGVWDTANNIAYIYIDGKQDASTTSGASSVGTSATTGTKNIGRSTGGSSYFTGSMDEVRVYNRALSASDVSQLYSFAPGPIGYWNFEEGSGGTVNDRSGSNNTGTWAGTGSHWGNGKYGKAGTFNASDDNVAITNTSFTKSFTHELWFYPTCNINQISIATGTGYYIKFNASGAGLEIGGGWLTDPGTGHSYVTGTVNSTSNIWQHVAVSFDFNTSTLNMYKNGALIFTQVITRNSTPTISTLGNTAYCGSIDDVKIYNYVRSPSQITEDMQGTSNLLPGTVGGGAASNTSSKNAGTKPNSAVVHLKFDESQGTTANNSGSLGSTGNGTLTNMASPATSTSGWTGNGKVNKGILFDGTDDSVTVPYTPPAIFSFSMWFYSNVAYTSAINRGLFSTFTGVTFSGIYVGTGGGYNGCNTLMFWTDGNIFNCLNTLLSANTWYHMTAVSDGSTVSIYINGKLDKTVTGTTTHASTIAIGRTRYNSDYWSGLIDEPKIFNFALTPEQVRQEYNLGTAVTYGGGGATESASLVDTAGSDPVGYWNLDERTGTTAKDSSGNANTGALTTSPVWAPGKIGSGVNFAPSNSYISVANASSLNITGDLTVEAWVKPNVIDSSSRVFLEKGDGTTAANRQYALRLNSSNKWEFFLYTSSTTNSTADTTTTPSTGRWDHVVGVRSGNTIFIYVNGVQRNSTTVSLATNTSTSILAFGRAGAGSSGYFGGQIDEVKIFNYARSPGQIAYDYNRGLPLAWWKMDECQGTTINDSSGNGNTQTLTVGASGTQTAAGTCNTSSTAWGNGATGKFNSSLKLDGTDDYISCSDANCGGTTKLDIGSKSITVAAWIKTSTTATRMYILSKGENVANNLSYDLEIATNGIGTCGVNNAPLFILYNTSANAYSNVCATASVTDGNWHHIVATYEAVAHTNTLYIDGKSQSSTTSVSATQVTDDSGPFTIGARGTSASGFFTGQIDDVRVYNYSLSATQVKSLYNNGTSVFYAPQTGSP